MPDLDGGRSLITLLQAEQLRKEKQELEQQVEELKQQYEQKVKTLDKEREEEKASYNEEKRKHLEQELNELRQKTAQKLSEFDHLKTSLLRDLQNRCEKVEFCRGKLIELFQSNFDFTCRSSTWKCCSTKLVSSTSNYSRTHPTNRYRSGTCSWSATWSSSLVCINSWLTRTTNCASRRKCQRRS